MCNFGSNSGRMSLEETLAAFDAHLALLDTGLQRIHVAPGGSFFSGAEVPPKLREGVLRQLGRFPFLQAVGIETRPNLVTREKLLDAVDALPATVRHLTIGFGFECRDDLVRELAVNKGYGPEEVLRARDLIEEVNDTQQGVHLAFEIYVLLKPIFLTEAEAIEEAIRTIEWSYAGGAFSCVLFLNTIKPRTIQEYLSRREDLPPPIQYRTPYYRSAVEVLRRLSPVDRKRTIVLGVQSGILAHGMPRGCALCSPFLLGALMAYNFTADEAILDEAATGVCPCQAAWAEELTEIPSPLLDRVRFGIDKLQARFSPNRQ